MVLLLLHRSRGFLLSLSTVTQVTTRNSPVLFFSRTTPPPPNQFFPKCLLHHKLDSHLSTRFPSHRRVGLLRTLGPRHLLAPTSTTTVISVPQVPFVTHTPLPSDLRTQSRSSGTPIVLGESRKPILSPCVDETPRSSVGPL